MMLPNSFKAAARKEILNRLAERLGADRLTKLSITGDGILPPPAEHVSIWPRHKIWRSLTIPELHHDMSVFEFTMVLSQCVLMIHGEFSGVGGMPDEGDVVSEVAKLVELKTLSVITAVSEGRKVELLLQTLFLLEEGVYSVREDS